MDNDRGFGTISWWAVAALPAIFLKAQSDSHAVRFLAESWLWRRNILRRDPARLVCRNFSGIVDVHRSLEPEAV